MLTWNNSKSGQDRRCLTKPTNVKLPRLSGTITTLRDRILVALLVAATVTLGSAGPNAQGYSADLIATRHLWAPRDAAAQDPRREAQQAVIDGWRLYRTQRGQEAFNHAMATLRATEGEPPRIAAFKGCTDLRCPLNLPRLSANGWLPAGRLWVSPSSYVLIVHSPRYAPGDRIPRRSRRSMRYFIFHEFQNSTGNTDPYDTISAHRSSVFVPFYMGKQQLDAAGHKFVVVIQVAPHDVASRHATSHGHAGPGIEVAKNHGERLSTLQAYAGILIALIVRQAEPQLTVDRHRGQEGLAMLRAYYQRRSAVRDAPNAPNVTLPFVAAERRQVAQATGNLQQIIAIDGKPAMTIASAVPREPLFAVPAPEPAVRPAPRIRPPAPQLVTFRPPVVDTQPVSPDGAPVAAEASSLTMEGLLQRLFGERSDADRSRNCALVWRPDCRG